MDSFATLMLVYLNSVQKLGGLLSRCPFLDKSLKCRLQ